MTGPLAGRSALTWLLIAACSLLAVKIYQQINGDPTSLAVSAALAPASAVPSVPQAGGFVVPPLATLTETIGRPLFRPDRRPPEPAEQPRSKPAVASARPAPQKSNAVLLGTIVSTDQRLALVRLSRQKGLTWVLEGQTIDGWNVVAIQPDRVTLKHGDAADQLWLDRKGQPAKGLEGSQTK